MVCNHADVVSLHHEEVAVHLLLKLLSQLLLGLLQLLVSELSDFGDHLAAHCNQSSVLRASMPSVQASEIDWVHSKCHRQQQQSAHTTMSVRMEMEQCLWRTFSIPA